MQSLSKFQSHFSLKKKVIPKISTEPHKKCWIAKTILSKKSNARDITIPGSKLYRTAIAMKQHSTGTKTDM
jgi:hypothetical protein